MQNDDGTSTADDDGIKIDYDGPLDTWMQLIILKKYETLKNLWEYDMEDYLALFELVLVATANETLSMMNMSRPKK